MLSIEELLKPLHAAMPTSHRTGLMQTGAAGGLSSSGSRRRSSLERLRDLRRSSSELVRLKLGLTSIEAPAPARASLSWPQEASAPASASASAATAATASAATAATAAATATAPSRRATETSQPAAHPLLK